MAQIIDIVLLIFLCTVAVAAVRMRDLFGMAQSDIERVVFPGLQMGDNPGLIL